MNKAKFQSTLRSKGIRISDDDPIFLLLSENEKILKEHVEEIQKSYAINMNTKQSKEEFARYNLAVITAGAIIVTLMLIVFSFWLGSVWNFVGHQLVIGFGLGLVVGLAITISVINISINLNSN